MSAEIQVDTMWRSRVAKGSSHSLRRTRRGGVAGAMWRWLFRASAVLDRSLDYDETLQNVVRLVVPRIADYAALALPAEDGSLTWAASTHCDPGKEPLIGRLRGYKPRRVASGGDSGRQGVRLVRHVSDDVLRSIADDDAHLSLLRALELTSVIVLPLAVGNRDIGSLILATTRESGRAYTGGDAVVGSGVARRAAAAVDRALTFRAATEAARARERLVALVSHDVRNPLNTILLAADYLLEDVIVDDTTQGHVREHLHAIARSARTADRLVNDLLDVAAIEAGQLRLQSLAVSAATLVQDAVDLLRPLASRKSIVLDADVEPSLPPVTADRDRLLQVFSNLGGNAIKFSPEGGRVEIAALAGKDGVEFVVRDTGPGIPNDDLPHIFQPFWQQQATRQSGVGLGLAIVRAIVEAHGGRVRVASELGVGTTFSFTIPAAIESHAAVN